MNCPGQGTERGSVSCQHGLLRSGAPLPWLVIELKAGGFVSRALP